MTETEFKRLLQSHREEAVAAVLRDFVNGTLDDGLEEIARILTVWATNQERRSYPFLDLGHDEALFAHACQYGTIHELNPRRRKPLTRRKS